MDSSPVIARAYLSSLVERPSLARSRRRPSCAKPRRRTLSPMSRVTLTASISSSSGAQRKPVRSLGVTSGATTAVCRRSDGFRMGIAGAFHACALSDRAAAFEVLPRRWVVERTFAWLGRCRRLANDFETTIARATAWVLVAHSRTLARRLARPSSCFRRFEPDSEMRACLRARTSTRW